jgi:hypothetical protein
MKKHSIDSNKISHRDEINSIDNKRELKSTVNNYSSIKNDSDYKQDDHLVTDNFHDRAISSKSDDNNELISKKMQLFESIETKNEENPVVCYSLKSNEENANYISELANPINGSLTPYSKPINNASHASLKPEMTQSWNSKEAFDECFKANEENKYTNKQNYIVVDDQFAFDAIKHAESQILEFKSQDLNERSVGIETDEVKQDETSHKDIIENESLSFRKNFKKEESISQLMTDQLSDRKIDDKEEANKNELNLNNPNLVLEKKDEKEPVSLNYDARSKETIPSYNKVPNKILNKTASIRIDKSVNSNANTVAANQTTKSTKRKHIAEKFRSIYSKNGRIIAEKTGLKSDEPKSIKNFFKGIFGIKEDRYFV